MHNNLTPDGRVTLLLAAMLAGTLVGHVAAQPKLRRTLRGHSHDHIKFRGVQPGRRDAGLRERGQNDHAVGRRQRREHRHAERAHFFCLFRGVRPGRQDPGLRERRQHRQAVGRGRGEERLTLRLPSSRFTTGDPPLRTSHKQSGSALPNPRRCRRDPSASNLGLTMRESDSPLRTLVTEGCCQ